MEKDVPKGTCLKLHFRREDVGYVLSSFIKAYSHYTHAGHGKGCRPTSTPIQEKGNVTCESCSFLRYSVHGLHNYVLCMYECIYICMYLSIYLLMYYIYVCMLHVLNLLMYYIYVCMHSCTYECIYGNRCMHMLTSKHAYIYQCLSRRFPFFSKCTCSLTTREHDIS